MAVLRGAALSPPARLSRPRRAATRGRTAVAPRAAGRGGKEDAARKALEEALGGKQDILADNDYVPPPPQPRAPRQPQFEEDGGGGNGGFMGRFGGGGGDPFDILNEFMRSAGRPRRGRDMRVQMTLSFLEAVRGCKKTVHIPSMDANGRRVGTRAIDISVPAGVDTGMQMNMDGEGAPGPDGLPPGNLKVLFEVQGDPRFERDGADLHTRFSVPMHVAALGAEVKVETVDGLSPVKLKEGIQSGNRIRLPGRGMPRVHGQGKGDLYVHVDVVTPKRLTDRQRELLREFGEEEEKKESGGSWWWSTG